MIILAGLVFWWMVIGIRLFVSGSVVLGMVVLSPLVLAAMYYPLTIIVDIIKESYREVYKNPRR